MVWCIYFFFYSWRRRRVNGANRRKAYDYAWVNNTIVTTRGRYHRCIETEATITWVVMVMLGNEDCKVSYFSHNKVYRLQFVLTLTPMCINHCVLSTFPNSVNKIHREITGVEFGTHGRCISRADVFPLDPRASPMVRGSSNPMC